jgi:hypothetical protein
MPGNLAIFRIAVNEPVIDGDAPISGGTRRVALAATALRSRSSLKSDAFQENAETVSGLSSD